MAASVCIVLNLFLYFKLVCLISGGAWSSAVLEVVRIWAFVHSTIQKVLWGIALYCLRKVNISCLQFFPSMTAVLAAFSSVVISLSASPFALDHTGVTLRWVKPGWVANIWKFSLLNGGPLPFLRTSGIPRLAKILSRGEITAFDDVDPGSQLLVTCWNHQSQPVSSLHLGRDLRNPRIALATDLVVEGTFVEA